MDLLASLNFDSSYVTGLTCMLIGYFQNYSVDFPPSKLKQGCGEHCLYVLDRLADEALRATAFKWGRYENCWFSQTSNLDVKIDPP